MTKYYLKTEWAEETEVTKEQFIKAERQSGFYPKHGDGLATSGFGCGGISGRVEALEVNDERD